MNIKLVEEAGIHVCECLLALPRCLELEALCAKPAKRFPPTGACKHNLRKRIRGEFAAGSPHGDPRFIAASSMFAACASAGLSNGLQCDFRSTMVLFSSFGGSRADL